MGSTDVRRVGLNRVSLKRSPDLGLMYGGQRTMPRAVRLYRKAADQGNALAQFFLPNG